MMASFSSDSLFYVNNKSDVIVEGRRCWLLIVLENIIDSGRLKLACDISDAVQTATKTIVGIVDAFHAT